MSTTPSPDRRFTVALTAAVAATTLAIGATTGALFGWIGPKDRSTEPTGSPSVSAGARVVYVPITPSAPPPVSDAPTASEPRIALATPDRDHDDRDRDREEDDDD